MYDIVGFRFSKIRNYVYMYRMVGTCKYHGVLIFIISVVDLAVMKLLPTKLTIPGSRAKPSGGHG